MSLDDLVNASTRNKPPVCVGKYIKGLGGDVAEYWDVLEKQEESSPGSVIRAKTARVLNDHFGIQASRDMVGDHFGRRCACGRS